MRPTFRILIGLSALFIAGCSAYFSVKGLGLLFVGSATAVMIMAASLEAGKLVAASFLYQYWPRINIPVRVYLMLAIGVLMGITSLGIYGYLARAYERTNSDVALLQQQIDSVQRELDDTQKRIDSSRGQLGRASDNERQDIDKLQQQIAQANQSLDTSLARLEDRRKAAREKRDGAVKELQSQATQGGQTLDQSLARVGEKRKAAQAKQDQAIELLKGRAAEADKLLAAALASEDASIAALNERVAVLDRAVDAYTREGGASFFKDDSIKKGQALRKEQQPQRDKIAKEIAGHREAQDKLRATRDADVKVIDGQMLAAGEQFAKENAALDEEEKSLRKGSTETAQSLETKTAAVTAVLTGELAVLDQEEKSLRLASAESIAGAKKQLDALQARGQSLAAEGGNQIDAMYQRLRTGNEEIGRLREQIAATDIGSYRFVARAFNAPVDDVVKWLILVIVAVFDPLAVALTIGFNIAMTGQRRRREFESLGEATRGSAASAPSSAASTEPTGRPKLGAAAAVVTIVAITALLAGGAFIGVGALREHARTAHQNLVPSDAFAVMAINPRVLQPPAPSAEPSNKADASKSSTTPPPVATAISELLASGFDPQADVYVFLKYPSVKSQLAADGTAGPHPVILCGLVARVTDRAAAEASLSKCAEAIGRAFRPPSAAAPLTRNRMMVSHGDARYLDPEGGFLTFGLTNDAAVLLVEIEGDPARPCVEREVQSCLSHEGSAARGDAATRAAQRHKVDSGGVVALWFDGARCFADMPKSAAALARYQQLQRYLDFDLSLTVQPEGDGRLNVVGRYAYTGERFNTVASRGETINSSTSASAVLELISRIGPSDAAGTPGRLMDRCADTLDFDSLIDRLRVALSGTTVGGPRTDVVVEKTTSSPREARFVLKATYDPHAGPPLQAAFQSLALF